MPEPHDEAAKADWETRRQLVINILHKSLREVAFLLKAAGWLGREETNPKTTYDFVKVVFPNIAEEFWSVKQKSDQSDQGVLHYDSVTHDIDIGGIFALSALGDADFRRKVILTSLHTTNNAEGTHTPDEAREAN